MIFIGFLCAFFALLYVWVLFPLAMWGLSRIFPSSQAESGQCYEPVMSVIIPALDEGDRISQRIEDIYSGDYPESRIQVIVISDGSTDNTASAARSCIQGDRQILVLENEIKSGRAFSHNRAIDHTVGDILVFTDAGTRFDKDFLKSVAHEFSNPRVGFASGALYHFNANSTAIAQSASLYWKFEQKLRTWESICRLNVVGSGPCCAMRKHLYVDIPPTGDVDFTSPLDAVLQGFLCVHIPGAIAYDEITSGKDNELKARIRMTSKNFRGTLGRWGMKGVIGKPVHTLVILSHKYGRWLTPFFMLIVLFCTVFGWLLFGGVAWSVLLLLQAIFYGMGVAGMYGSDLPLAKTIFSFLLGNLGMLIGVLKVLRGSVPATYTPIRND